MKIKNGGLYLGPGNLREIFSEVIPEEEFQRGVTKAKRKEAKEQGILLVPRNQDELRGRLREGGLEDKILVLPPDCIVTGSENNAIAKHLSDYQNVGRFFLRLDKRSVVINTIKRGVEKGWITDPPENIIGLTFGIIEDYKIYPSALIGRAFENHEGIPWGFYFRGVDGIYRLITFLRGFEGAQLLAAHDKGLIQIKDNDKIDPFYASGIAKTVQSISEPNKWYDTTLSKLALSPKKVEFGNWRRTFGVCSCKDYIYNALLHGGSRHSHFVFFCKHLTLLHNYALRKSGANQSEESLRVNLIPYPSEGLAIVLDLLQHRVYCMDKKGDPQVVNKGTINNCLGLAMERKDIRFWTKSGEKKPLEYMLPES